MLGKEVTAKITKVVERESKRNIFMDDDLYYAELCDYDNEPAFVYGARRRDYYFDGTVVGALIPPANEKGQKKKKTIWIVAPSDSRPINIDLLDYLTPREIGDYTLKCLYEISCGAVICKREYDGIKYLLIKNNHSGYWGWPKGHMEKSENRFDTARREVFEETHLKIKIFLGFEGVSEYTLSDKTQKTVYIYAAQAEQGAVIPQREEVSAYKWADYDTVLSTLKFPNDKKIFVNAVNFLNDRGCFDNALRPGALRKSDMNQAIKITLDYDDMTLTEAEKEQSGLNKKQEKYIRAALRKKSQPVQEDDGAFHLPVINPNLTKKEKSKLNRLHIGV